MPALGVLLAAAGGSIAIIVAASLFVRSSDAPAHATGLSHLFAPVDHVTVLDGDTLRIGNQVVRLEGVAVPARGSVCHEAGQASVDCGSAAANALANLVRGAPVDCAIKGHDGQGRPVGDCLAGGTRLNVALVLDGWARADTANLREPESAARTARRGIWHTGS